MKPLYYVVIPYLSGTWDVQNTELFFTVFLLDLSPFFTDVWMRCDSFPGLYLHFLRNSPAAPQILLRPRRPVIDGALRPPPPPPPLVSQISTCGTAPRCKTCQQAVNRRLLRSCFKLENIDVGGENCARFQNVRDYAGVSSDSLRVYNSTHRVFCFFFSHPERTLIKWKAVRMALRSDLLCWKVNPANGEICIFSHRGDFFIFFFFP